MQPMTNPWQEYGLQESDAHDALAEVSRMLTGSKILQQEPGIVYDLAAQKARPQDAQAIDQFMQQLDAERKVQIARAVNQNGGGGYINLTSQERQLLDSEGFHYQDVLYSTSVSAAQDAARRIQDLSGGTRTAKTNADGTLALDANGNIQTAPMQQPKPSSGGGGNIFSRAAGAVGGAFKTAGLSVWHGATKAFNFAQAGITGEFADKLPGHQIFDTQDNILHTDATRAQDMLAQGYDPSSIWSTFAFGASGHAHSDLSSLNDKYGEEKVNDALRFLNDPKGYREAIENDPGSYSTDADGRVALTPDAYAKLKHLQSPEFETLVRQVNARAATVGNDLMNSLSVDPIHHATLYGIGAAGTNIAASFLIDPTMLGLQGVKVAKLSAVGIDTLGDADKAASILTRSSKLPWVNNIQRGWNRAIDYGEQMRTAHAAGDTEKLAALTAKFNAELPSLSPLMGEFSGLSALKLEEVAGKVTPQLVQTAGIRSLEDAARWVRSKEGLNLLREGRAATQSSFMPGALSAFGYRKVKGAVSGWMTARSASRAENAYASVVAAADADPAGIGEKLITDGVLRRVLPEADDAVHVFTDQTLADKQTPAEVDATGAELAPGLASARRAAFELTSAGKGEVARSLRGGTTRTALDELTKVGKFTPTAIAARSRLAAQRFGTLLPRNTRIALTDTDSADKVFRYAMTYLNRGDANTLRALWVTGDSAARKQIVQGLLDQVGHAAGFGKTESGRNFLDAMHTAQEAYSAAGDELLVNGTPHALFQGQTQTVWNLPSFPALLKHAGRLGLFDATLGRAASAQVVDDLMSHWKSIMLLAPKTAPRNMIEGWLRAILEGQAGNAFKTKALATARNKELWKYRLGQASHEEYDEAIAAGDMERANEIANGSMLSGEELGRSGIGYRIADLAPISLAARAYRSLYLKHMDPRRVEALIALGPDRLAEIARGYHSRILESDLGLRNGAKQATAVAKAGFGPATYRMAKARARAATAKQASREGEITRWTHQALDDTIGASRYANELARRVNAMPQTAKAILDRLEDRGSVESVIAALEKESKDTAFGRVYFDNPDGAPNEARWAATAEEREAGKRPFAQKLVNEFSYLLHGQNGKYQQELADYIREHGEAPSDAWIVKHLKGDNRPEGALAPEVIALQSGGPSKLAPSLLQDATGATFQWVVERTIQRTTSMPIFLANYVEERVGLDRQVEKLVAEGFSQKAAENFAEDLATRRAFVRTEQIIDDPGQKTQFDVIARNFFPWSRAVNAMIRRWGAGLWQNPANARRLMLAYEGAVHSGLFFDNVYGEPTFTYPLSGVLGMTMHALSKVPGFDGIAQFPLATDMTGNVVMAVPGADNPFRFSMSPVASIPLREVYKHLLPTSWRGEATSLDEIINGPIGVGQTFSQLVPSYVRRFYDAFQPPEKNAAVASAVNGAIANLAAAGYIPATNATAAQLQQFRSRVQTQVKNQLVLRAVFGLFAPSAPSSPSEEAPGTQADFAWQFGGLKQLSDEYKSILNEVDGDVGRATAIFTALHPDEVVYKGSKAIATKLPASAYETGFTKSTTPGAYLPATGEAFKWMNDHAGFINRYKSVAAYFLPESSVNDPFSDAAYKAQIEFGLRVRKAPEEFLNDVYVRHAENAYYPTVAIFDQKINSAEANGDSQGYDYWTQAKSKWEQQYRGLNPLFGDKQRQDGYGPALNQLSELKQMLARGDVPGGQAAKLGLLVKAYENYESFIREHAGGSDADTALRSQALKTFNSWSQQTIAGTPLVDLYNGVFLNLNTNLDRIGGV